MARAQLWRSPAALLCALLLGPRPADADWPACAHSQSVSRCHPCIVSDQCASGLSCDGHTKLCVEGAGEACDGLDAGCEQACLDTDNPKACECKNQFFPSIWPKVCHKKGEGEQRKEEQKVEEEEETVEVTFPDDAMPICNGEEEDVWQQDFCKGDSTKCCTEWFVHHWGADFSCFNCKGTDSWGQTRCPATCCKECGVTEEKWLQQHEKKTSKQVTTKPTLSPEDVDSNPITSLCKDHTWQIGMPVGATTQFAGKASDPVVCIAMVQEACPTALGASMRITSEGSCWCVLGHGELDGHKWGYCEFAVAEVTSTMTTTTTMPQTTTMRESVECAELGLADKPGKDCPAWWFKQSSYDKCDDLCKDNGRSQGRTSCAQTCCTQCGPPAAMAEDVEEIVAPQCATEEDTATTCSSWFSRINKNCTMCEDKNNTNAKKCAGTCCLQCRSTLVLASSCESKVNDWPEGPGPTADDSCDKWWDLLNMAEAPCDECKKALWQGRCSKKCCEGCALAPSLTGVCPAKNFWKQDWCPDSDHCCATWWSATWGAQEGCNNCAGSGSWGMTRCPGTCCKKCTLVDMPMIELDDVRGAPEVFMGASAPGARRLLSAAAALGLLAALGLPVARHLRARRSDELQLLPVTEM